jgi:hypothetical protein
MTSGRNVTTAFILEVMKMADPIEQLIKQISILDAQRRYREKNLAKMLLAHYDNARKELYIKFIEAHSNQDTLRLQYLEGTLDDIERKMKYYTNLTINTRQDAITQAHLDGQEFAQQAMLSFGPLPVVAKINIGIGLVNKGMVEALVGNVPNLAGRVQNQVLFRIREELVKGAIMGESIPKIAKRILGTGITQDGLKKPFPSIEKRCTTIARTEIIKASDRGYEDFAIEAQKNLKEEIFNIWLTAGDGRVDPECRQLAAGTHPSFHSIPGHPGIYSRLNSPIPVVHTHPNCRCRRIPFLKSWEALGVFKMTELSDWNQRQETRQKAI